MVQIIGSKDCGNSPKNQFAQDVAIAMETGRIPEGMLNHDTIWQRHDNLEIKGSAAIEKAFAQHPDITSIHVSHAISHGKIAMANGKTTLADGSSRQFCHVFEFTNTKGNCVATINSYS